MSDLTERLDAISTQLAENANSQGEGPFAAVSDHDYPGLKGADEFIKYMLVKGLRPHYRDLAGTPHATSFDEAFDKTQRVHTEMVAAITGALACGLEIGEGTSYQVKRHRDTGQMNELFDHKGFNRDVELRAMQLIVDPDLPGYLRERMEASVKTLAMLSGIATHEGPEISAKIWDLWYLTARSISMIIYIAGTEMGKVNATTQTLDGILQATEKEDS